MVTVYITTNANKEIESVNQSIEGAARFAYGLGVSQINGSLCSYQAMLEHFEKNPSADLLCDDEKAYRVERHFVAA